MSDTDDETSPSQSGYLTPPLSPTKTVCTEDWSSPRTPQSPRKSRSCLFFSDNNNNSDTTRSSLISQSSPSKSKFFSRLQALSTPDLRPIKREAVLEQSNDQTCPDHRRVNDFNSSFFNRSTTLAHSNVPFASTTAALPLDEGDLVPQGGLVPQGEACNSNPPRNVSLARKSRRTDRSSSDSLVSILSRGPSPSPNPIDTATTFESSNFTPLRYTDASSGETSRPAKLRQLPLRYASSPLRPSQWVARGGFLPSPRPNQTSTPDRFIASRRLPAVTRESFELNSPAERRDKEQNMNRGTRRGSDAFSRRLRRSGRMNEELRGLREAHSVVSGRANANRRNVNFRRNPLTLGARQISAGAVWNVGGPSAVSDTVVAVSTGRGGMLGSGTNAPLYKSAFLNRADPDAELEAYERRLALALDIDQTDRILQHSSSAASPRSQNSGPASQTKHVWRDGAWLRDGVDPSSFIFLTNVSALCCC